MNVLRNRTLSRRTLLQGVGVSIGLPFLEAMTPGRVTAAASRSPKRIAFFYIPNGVVGDAWHPRQVGSDFELPASLEPLAGLRDRISLFTGLDREFRGGTGVHAQAACSWLTSSPPSEALDGGFPTNTTLDQIIAGAIGHETPIPSLELSTNNHSNSRETKYFETVSWFGPGYAATPEKDPREVWHQLFGKPNPKDQSVLDLVLADAKRLQQKIGHADRSTLEEYLDSIRSVESQIERATKAAEKRDAPAMAQPDGIPTRRDDYLRLMGDLMVLAFQQDITRVSTLLVDPERWDTPRAYNGVFDDPQNHHALTHTKGDEAKDKLQRIDRFHVAQFAYVVEKMKHIPDGEGTLLDHCAVCLGSGMGDGRVHDYNNVPVVIAGELSGQLKSGHHWKYEGHRPLADLWLALLHGMEIQRERFADSSGVLNDVLA
ncbi:MAG: DUF1552 domain-containing protein [Verrucomicrobiota bacterium]